MPPTGRLSDPEIKVLEEWVKRGAPDPRSGQAAAGPAKPHAPTLEQGRRFWSFRPIVKPAMPTVKKASRIQSPIDTFILSRLEKAGLSLAPPADRRTLIRRATFDLIGLPPTPQEVDAFVADKSPDAFDKVVERLLASHHYGERWGRHWLDVARYADSNGLDENMAYGEAWRYRDYVVRAFNEDKPFDRFLIEQIAGDLLPFNEDALTATGFLSLGAHVLAEPDVQKLEMDVIDEQLDTMGKAFLGMTIGCARCHDHKFDPLKQEEYYALAGIFRNTRSLEIVKGKPKTWYERPLATSAQIEAKKKRDELIARQKADLSALTSAATGGKPAAPDAARAKIDALSKSIAKLESEQAQLPQVMSVTEADAIAKTLPVHIRGDYLTLGKPVERGFPGVMCSAAAKPALPDNQSGRLELARWMAGSEHPLTARVMVNRLWRWHFGQGIVSSTDNFGILGSKPSHPELLDWLARTFSEGDWSIKRMHRLIMKSAAYQQSSSPIAGKKDPRSIDPENRLLWRANIRRLEAEEIRDGMLAVSGWLNLEIGGKTIPLKDKEYVFDHTSKDSTTYESPRRALYLPIIRNHLYDMLEQFDYPDPTMPTGSRNSTVIAPQALIMMNAPIVVESSKRLAARLELLPDDDRRIKEAYELLYARPPLGREKSDALALIHDLRSAGKPEQTWSLLCQALLAANEFIYLR
jgi:hypothetical protein